MAKITTLDGVTHDVEVGDKVRITLKGGDSSDITVAVAALGSLESKHNFFSGSYIQSLEILERYAKLPTKDGAVVGHATYGAYVTYQLSRDKNWFKVDTSCGGSIHGVTEEDVRQSMTTAPEFTVLYEGRG
jgi:hypothetical protein